MQTFRRIVAVLIFPAIAWLGVACERPSVPTEARPMAVVVAQNTLVVDEDGLASAASCNDNTPTYMTIGTAEADAMPNDVIQVCPGPYAENVLVDVMNLTLLGAQAENPVAMRAFGGLLESTVTGTNPTAGVPVFQVAATNVTIDGFSVTNSVVSGDAFGIGVRVTGSDAVIANNIVHVVTTPDPNGAAQAIYLQNGPDRVSILGNDLKYVQSNRSAKGVFVGDAGSADPSMNVLIEGNSITNITSVQLPPSNISARGAYGVLINNGSSNMNPTNNTGLEIRNNTINNLSSLGWVHAIGLEANTPNVVVRDNSIAALVSPSPDKVAVFFEANPSYATGSVNQNNFNVTSAAYGIAHHPFNNPGTGDVNGTCNWWGDPNGPGPVGPSLAGAKVSPRVDFTPWLVAPAPGGVCAGGLPSGGQVTGGGQIKVTGGTGSFGFSANATRQRGHLDYMNHVNRKHLNCTVDVVTILSATKAQLSGTCSSKSDASSFRAEVEDNGTPGKNNDKFRITYPNVITGGTTEGGTIISGNIEIH
jgi:hypothetical protein